MALLVTNSNIVDSESNFANFITSSFSIFNDSSSSILLSPEEMRAIVKEADNYHSDSLSPLCQSIARYASFRFIVDVLLVGPVCLLGLVGNTLSIMAMRRLENGVVSMLFGCLAVVDNAYLAMCLIIQTIKALGECTKHLSVIQHYLPYAEPFLWPVASMAQTATVWMVILITVDRYFALCRPFNSACRIGSKRKAGWAVAIIVLAAIVFNVPRFFDQSVILSFDSCQNVTRPWAAPTAFKNNRTYFVLYHNVAYFIFRLVVPLLTVGVLNVCLISVLRKAREDRLALCRPLSASARSSRTPAKRSDSYTILLVAMVTVFIICSLPDFAGRVWYAVYLVVGMEQYGTFTHYYFTVTNLLLTLNSAVNCLIYSLAGRRFRTALYGLTCKRKTAGAAVDILQRAEVVNSQYQDHAFAHRSSSRSRASSSLKEKSSSVSALFCGSRSLSTRQPLHRTLLCRQLKGRELRQTLVTSSASSASADGGGLLVAKHMNWPVLIVVEQCDSNGNSGQNSQSQSTSF